MGKSENFLTGGVGGVVSGIASLIGQRRANRTNLKINRENIAAAYNLQDKANAFSREQFAAENEEFQRRWEQENEYNTPYAQRQRIEEAGLNPWLAMDGSNFGSGTSNVSTHSGASGSPPSQIPVQNPYDVNSITSVVDSVANMTESLASAKRNHAEANSINLIAPERVAQIRQDIAESMTSQGYMGRQMDDIASQINARNQKLSHEVDVLDATFRNLESQTAYQALSGRMLTQKTMADIQKMQSDIRLNKSIATLNMKLGSLHSAQEKLTAKKAYTEELNQIAKTYGRATAQDFVDYQWRLGSAYLNEAEAKMREARTSADRRAVELSTYKNAPEWLRDNGFLDQGLKRGQQLFNIWRDAAVGAKMFSGSRDNTTSVPVTPAPAPQTSSVAVPWN